MKLTTLERLRFAPKAWFFAALALAALVALVFINPRDGGGDAVSSPLETRLERVLSGIEGVEGVSAMVTQDDTGGVTGVLIVCRRMDGLRAGLRLQRAVQALLGVELERISVLGGDDDLFGTEAANQ